MGMAVKSRVRFRIEQDSLGEKSVPASAYYGIETQRAVENFPVSGLRSPAVLVAACARIKKAAALANARLGLLERAKARAIAMACDEIVAGRFADDFVVDVFQMGAGTSFHMNVNEVVANRAEEILGGRRGEYRLVSPHDDVNMAQSTNDIYPTAVRLACLELLLDALDPALDRLERSLRRKARAFDRVLKSGRTHLQDAVPIRLGQEFAAYAAAVAGARAPIAAAGCALRELGIGGSAVGTGLNTDPRFGGLVVARLAAGTRMPLVASPDPIAAMQSLRPFADLSAALRNLALELSRIANDLRLLASGPRTGLAEIALPAVAPGSSIMPGKVNPSLLEMLNQVAFQVLGADLTVSAAVQAGQLELNVMMPVVAFNLLFMIRILANAVRLVTAGAIDGLTADAARCRAYAYASPGLATVLSPIIGYAAAAEVARQALRTGRSVADVVRERGLLDPATLDRVLDPAAMTAPGIPTHWRRRPAKPRRKGSPRGVQRG
ncbi:MAG TPA: aspartate ammonia-lyase [Acidobacteriota bacterium]|nr:aspartate ammonia-lyase [Acidobacteriota bacterium]